MTDELQELRRRLVVGRKNDGRSVYDTQAKAELVALCLQPGASVSRLARECGVNANQVSRWLREHGHVRRPRVPVAPVAQVSSPPSAFMAVPVMQTTATPADGSAAMHLQARLPNGVAFDLRGVDARHAGHLIEALGRLRCSGSTKG
ncbi:transposase [Ideonella azotifigens]|uniref:IS66-like element accessory protein TnpA n=1 Tax=Ideonella azotifigens TaxID=513160 RepID=UPI001E2E4A50|nr:transposase [Ideonella azotifigens]MCD2340814.1 transposase [Ideonella azotifigens]